MRPYPHLNARSLRTCRVVIRDQIRVSGYTSQAFFCLQHFPNGV